MPNPSPVQTQAFRRKQYKAQGEPQEALAKSPISVRLTVSADAILRSAKNRQALIRKYVLEGLSRDGLT